MSSRWSSRKRRLGELLNSTGSEEEGCLVLDRLLHGQSVIGKTSKTVEIDELRFSNKDLHTVGTLEYGQYGVIDLVKCKLDGRVYVRKSTEKKFAVKTREQCFPLTERDILLRARISNSSWAPHLLCAFQTETHLNLVMQYAEGGTLWDILESSPLDGRISEEDLRWWIPQVVSAIHWCHSQGFAHRDIKPHNFVLTSTSHVLLIDFGSAAPLEAPSSDGSQKIPKQFCLVPCGTCDYISPEILAAHEAALVALEMEDGDPSFASRGGDSVSAYGREVDWWSMGAMLYEMAYGIAPFFAKDIKQTYSKIMDHQRSLRFNESVRVPASLQDLLRRLLTNSASRLGRRNIMEITEHPFFEYTNWTNLSMQSAPVDLHLPQFTYASPGTDTKYLSAHSPSVNDEESYSRPFTFSALFQSSPDYARSTTSIPQATPASNKLHRSSLLDQAVTSFIGFSWGPLDNAFSDTNNEDLEVRPDLSVPESLPTPRPRNPRALSILHTTVMTPAFPPDLHPFATPVRPVSNPHAYAQTLPRTATVHRTVPRRTVSDREAMRQLVDCVSASARKKVLESGRKPRILSGHIHSTGTLRKTLRFSSPPPIAALPAMSGTDDTETETEGPPSPSPSPRPGSAMSMISRRSQTPTMSGSYSQRLMVPSTPSITSTLFPPTRPAAAQSNAGVNRSVTTPSARLSGSQASLQTETFSTLEERHARIMSDIQSIETRLGYLTR